MTSPILYDAEYLPGPHGFSGTSLPTPSGDRKKHQACDYGAVADRGAGAEPAAPQLWSLHVQRSPADRFISTGRPAGAQASGLNGCQPSNPFSRHEGPARFSTGHEMGSPVLPHNP
jgi:hypothetical protein